MSTEVERLTRIPVTVVGGYLGAGKTTLVNRLLQESGGRRLAVLVNDFGEINVDAALIREHRGRTLSLANGCICCSIAGDLTSALREVVANSGTSDGHEIDHIVIEASGVADPAKIAMHALGWPDLVLDGIVTLTDARTTQDRARDRYVGTTVTRQIRASDLLIVSKSDIAHDRETAATVTCLNALAPGVPVMTDLPRGAICDVVLGIDASRGHAGLSSAVERGHGPHDAAATFASATWYPAGPVARAALVCELREMAAALPRCKGWLRFADDAQSIWLVQAVGSRIAIQPCDLHRVSTTRRLDAEGLPVGRRPFLSLIYLADLISEAEVIARLDTSRFA